MSGLAQLCAAVFSAFVQRTCVLSPHFRRLGLDDTLNVGAERLSISSIASPRTSTRTPMRILCVGAASRAASPRDPLGFVHALGAVAKMGAGAADRSDRRSSARADLYSR